MGQAYVSPVFMFMLWIGCGAYLIPAAVCCLAVRSVFTRQVEFGVGGTSQQPLFCLLSLLASEDWDKEGILCIYH